MSIVDEIAARSPFFRNVAASAHIVQTPFKVWPMDDCDGHWGLCWRHRPMPPQFLRMREHQRDASGRPIGRTVDATLARPPYNDMILFGANDRGVLVLQWMEADVMRAVEAIQESPAAQQMLHDAALRDTRASGSTWGGTVEPMPPPGLARYSLAELQQGYGGGALVGMFRQYMIGENPLMPGSFVVAGPYGSAVTEERIGALPFYGVFSLAASHVNPVEWPEVPDSGARWSNAEVRAHAADNLRRYWRDNLSHFNHVNGTAVPLDSMAGRYQDEAQLTRAAADIAYDHDGTTRSVVAACSLLNARNIVQERVTPPHPRAARRRGDLPPYSYHVLKVHPFSAKSRSAARERTLSDDTVPLHWVRGHFKYYGARWGNAGLFGRIEGAIWFQPHLAGNPARVVDKDYEIDGGAASE